MRSDYLSWREYCIGSFIGRKLCIEDDNVDYYEDMAKKLLFNKYGAWYKLN